jgi:alkanesulfonate monooxygenase SsuD/methylene tetrahydromethanopterin reductase-like flavin-dependent oxidoreductase (luciferase family)
MRHALNFPLFGPLSHPSAAVDIAVAADERGWDGFFVWDHVLHRWAPDSPIADPWVVLAAAAARTSTVHLGTMVTPLARRRVVKLAREVLTLDHLSEGRVVLGVGLGSDGSRELSAFDEAATDPATRQARFEEALELLPRLWSERVTHRGALVVDDVDLHQRPVRPSGIPIWTGCQRISPSIIRRAAALDGVYPIDAAAEQVAELLDGVAAVRGSLEGFDVAMAVLPGDGLEGLERAGATWALHSFLPGDRPEQVLDHVDRGPGG